MYLFILLEMTRMDEHLVLLTTFIYFRIKILEIAIKMIVFQIILMNKRLIYFLK